MNKKKVHAAHLRIEALANENRNRVTADLVLADACDPDSPLHPMFDWEDSVAAHKWRLAQARQLIATVGIKRKESDFKTVFAPKFIRDPDAGKQQGYVSTDVLKRNKSKSREALKEECNRAASLMRRARSIAESLGLEGEADEIIEAITGLAGKVED